MSTQPLFYLYSSEGCHLCEQAWQLCFELGIGNEVTVVDIVNSDDSEQLVERYGIRIPVIKKLADQSELGWPFDIEQLQEFVNGINSN